MSTSKTVFIVLATILGLVLLNYIMKKYRLAQLQGRPLTLNDLLGTPTPNPITHSFSFSGGKCYDVSKDTINGNTSSSLTDISNCYNLPDFQSALKDEYTNIQNQLATPPMNPPDQNDIDHRAQLTQRANDITELFRKIKGCTEGQIFDWNTLTCFTPTL